MSDDSHTSQKLNPGQVLNPNQQVVLDSLAVSPSWEPLPDDIADELEEMLTTELAPAAAHFSIDSPLRVTKHGLATIHGCEQHFLAERAQPFAWNVAMVRGTVAHKAIELLINWRGPVVPGELVDAAIDSIVHNPRETASDFIASLSGHELAELRGHAVQLVTVFIECWPPLRPQWRPIVEYNAKFSAFGGTILFTTRMDLVLGQPGRKAIIDLKSGYISTQHRDDLRFYALVETLRSRRAPRVLSTYSLEQARLDTEPVTADLLRAAVRRTAHGTNAMAEVISLQRAPVLRPGAQCRWCPLSDDCDTGREYLRQIASDSF